MSSSFPFKFLIDERTMVVVDYVRKPKSERCPSGTRWAVVGLVRNGTWKEAIRIDNSPHKGRDGTHIHLGKRVVYKEFANYEAALDYVIAFLRRA